MNLYAYRIPGIPQHDGYLKIGETHRSIDSRISQQGGQVNVEKVPEWHDAIATERTGIDRLFRHFLRDKYGFHIQPNISGHGESEWVKCTVEDIKAAFPAFKELFYQEQRERQLVTDQFYQEIRNWFYWTTQDHKDIDADYAMRVIIRLLFCFFLREKDALVPKELLDASIEKLLDKNEEHSYYNGILRNLFFHCLNIPGKREYENEKLFVDKKNIKDWFSKIPFLNGGLFDEHEKDDIPIGNDYFFSQRKTRLLTELGETCDVYGIITILSKYQYKLTLDDLLDQAEYGKTVDSEFIGKVFESLLSCIDSDNKESRRKVTGSYYTPREIVDYMVNSVLDTYLEQSRNRKIAQDDSQSYNYGSELLQCKILDPACGSGAFPCEVMNIIMHRIEEDMKEREDRELTQQERYRIKLKIIRDVIYGVDIQPMAVQITLLRFFLSLIQDIIPDKRKANYGIEPLPNLETKFVCANTLIPLVTDRKDADGRYQKMLEDPIIRNITKLLRDNRNQYFGANMIDRKREIQQTDKTLRETLAIAMEGNGMITHATTKKMAKWNPYDQSHSAPFFDPFWMFELIKFDIVIGNPPYVSAPTMVASNPAGRQAIIDANRYTTLFQKWDLYVPFMEFGLRILSESGVFAMIVPYPLTNQIYAQKIRELIISQYNLVEIADLSGTKIFASATVSNCIPIIINAPPGSSCYISHINEKKKINRSFTQTYADLVIDDYVAVWNLATENREANRHTEMNVLGDFCYISKGMVLNADERTAKREFVKDDLISDTQDLIHCRKYIEAKDIERYRVKRIRYLEYGTERCPDKLSRPTFPELYEQPKLMFNRLGELQVFYDEKTKFLHSDSMYSAVLWKDLKDVKNRSISASVKRYSRHSRKKMEAYSKRIDLRFLLGILNSEYASLLLSNRRGGDYHIYPDHLRSIPIPLVSKRRQQTIVVLVNKILTAKKENPTADTTDWERKIDALVYKLYELLAEEIAIIEGGV